MIYYNNNIGGMKRDSNGNATIAEPAAKNTIPAPNGNFNLYAFLPINILQNNG